MLTFILLLVITIISYICYRMYKIKNDDKYIPYGIILIVCGLSFISCCLSMINIRTRFEVEKAEYINAKIIAESYDNTDKDRIEAFDLMKLVYKTNNSIDKHKACSKSLWVGPWYSKEIGNLPKIQLKKVN